MVRHYQKQPEDLDKPLQSVFIGNNFAIHDPLYTEWATECLKSRPELHEYLVEAKDQHVNTLRDFVRVFG